MDQMGINYPDSENIFLMSAIGLERESSVCRDN